MPARLLAPPLGRLGPSRACRRDDLADLKLANPKNLSSVLSAVQAGAGQVMGVCGLRLWLHMRTLSPRGTLEPGVPS